MSLTKLDVKCKIESLVKDLNQKLDDLVSYVNMLDEDDSDILKYLNQNKGNIKIYLDVLKSKNNRKGKEKSSVVRNKLYTKEEVYTIIQECNSNSKELATKYNKKELSDMFYTLYSIEPSSSKNKEDIATDIRLFMNGEFRVAGLVRL